MVLIFGGRAGIPSTLCVCGETVTIWRHFICQIYLFTNWQLRCEGSHPLALQKQKSPYLGDFIFGGRAGIRTLDPLIKSQLLYQLSYASKTEQILADYKLFYAKCKCLCCFCFSSVFNTILKNVFFMLKYIL